MALLSCGERFGLGGFVSSMWYLICSRKACASLSSFILLARSSVLAMISNLGISLAGLRLDLVPAPKPVVGVS